MLFRSGLSPKENRDVPPLDYDLVMRMKQLFPNLHISINGGVANLDQALALLDQGLDGVMIGRAAYHQPWDVLAGADTAVWGAPEEARTREDVARAMMPYAQAHVEAGGKLAQVTRHMLGLFAGLPGARAWRRTLSEEATRPGADATLIETALARPSRARITNRV